MDLKLHLSLTSILSRGETLHVLAAVHQRKGPQYPTDKRFGRPLSRYGSFGNRNIFFCYSQRQSRILNRGPSRYQAGMLPTWQKYSIVTYERPTFYDPELVLTHSTTACWSEPRLIKSRWRNTDRQQQKLISAQDRNKTMLTVVLILRPAGSCHFFANNLVEREV